MRFKGTDSFIKRFTALNIALFLYGIGIIITVNANIGVAPWDVFHLGFAKVTGMSFGVASILIGLVVLLFSHLMGEKIGLGTVLNMVLIGIFVDLIIYLDFLPKPENFAIRVIYLLFGLLIIAYATYLYIVAGFGAGPRDSAMVGLHRLTGLPIGLCRGGVEVTVTILGYLLGGPVGVGTLICAVCVGPIIQQTFKLVDFDPRTVVHETFSDTWKQMTR